MRRNFLDHFVSYEDSARRMGGQVYTKPGTGKKYVACPALGHSRADRGVTFEVGARHPDGLLVKVHNDVGAELANKDHIFQMHGAGPFVPSKRGNGKSRPGKVAAKVKPAPDPVIDDSDEIELTDIDDLPDMGGNSAAKAKRRIVEEYNYTDASGVMKYQVVRYEPKDFRPRHPDGNGGWIWNLNGIEQLPYRLDEITKYPDAPVAACEGEKDANRVRALGYVATNCADGQWPNLAKYFQGREVTILGDFNKTGTERALRAAIALHGVAHSIKMIFLPGLNGDDKNKDVSDWLDKPGNDETKFADICRHAPLWTPGATVEGFAEAELVVKEKEAKAQPTKMKFTSFANVKFSTSSRYLVKGILPSSGLVVVWGPPKCGKSFSIFDMTMHVSLGREYRGRRVKQCPVVYFALEGQLGFEARIEAFRQTHSVHEAPFYLSTNRIVLPQDGAEIVASIQSEVPGTCPGIVVLDTLNRSMTGSENDPADMTAYIKSADLIRESFDCLVVIIHHCGTEGARPRGHTSLTGAADAQLAVSRDANQNVAILVEHMKDGPEGDRITSTLEHIEVGVNDEGDQISSCVLRPASNIPASTKKIRPKGHAATALRILADTINEGPETPPPEVASRTNSRTVLEKTWKENFDKGTAGYVGLRTSLDKAFARAVASLQEAQLIGKWGDYVWLA